MSAARRQRRGHGGRLLLQVLGDARDRREPALVVPVGDGLDRRRARVHAAGLRRDEASGDERGGHALGRQPPGELHHGVHVALGRERHHEDVRHGCCCAGFFFFSLATMERWGWDSDDDHLK